MPTDSSPETHDSLPPDLPDPARKIVYYLAGRLCRRRMSQHYDDCVQEGMIAAWKIYSRYDGSTTLSTFLALRVQGAMKDWLRRQSWFGPAAGRGLGRMSGVKMVQMGGTVNDSVAGTCYEAATRDLNWYDAPVLDPDYSDQSEEEFDLLLRRLLPWSDGQDRLVLCLYFFRGLTMEEAAVAAGRSQSLVSTIITESVRDMRKELGSEFGGNRRYWNRHRQPKREGAGK